MAGLNEVADEHGERAPRVARLSHPLATERPGELRCHGPRPWRWLAAGGLVGVVEGPFLARLLA
ncbi:MAG: hypothetical protein ACXWLA_00895, partial [Myxococcaceae bacterium]